MSKELLQHATFPANCDYHANDRLSWTGLKLFIESPLKYKYRFIDGNDNGPTPAMQLGSLVHCLVLTPNLIDEEFRVREEMPLRSKENKKAFIDHLIAIDCADVSETEILMDMKADDLRSLETKTPFSWIDDDLMTKGKAIAEVVKPHFPNVNGSLDPKTCNVEAAFEATLEGHKVQCKTDHITPDGLIQDIKTTADLGKWITGMEKGEYLLGDAFYRMVIESATGILPPPIQYVGVSTTEPYDVAIRAYPDDLYSLASLRVRQALKSLTECLKSGLWPGIDGEAKPTCKDIKVKPWAIKQLESEAMNYGGVDDLAQYILATVE